jgi:hypothetical protein
MAMEASMIIGIMITVAGCSIALQKMMPSIGKMIIG